MNPLSTTAVSAARAASSARTEFAAAVSSLIALPMESSSAESLCVFVCSRRNPTSRSESSAVESITPSWRTAAKTSGVSAKVESPAPAVPSTWSSMLDGYPIAVRRWRIWSGVIPLFCSCCRSLATMAGSLSICCACDWVGSCCARATVGIATIAAAITTSARIKCFSFTPTYPRRAAARPLAF